MKKRVLAWLLTLCLLAGVIPLTITALAEEATYVWVGMQLDDSEYDAPDSTTEATITNVSVTVGGQAPAESLVDDAIWFNAGAAIAYTFDDTLTDNTYQYSVSVDGEAFTAISDGFVIGNLGLTTETTPYVMIFRVADEDDSTNYADSIPYYVYYDDEAPVLLCKTGEDNTVYLYSVDAASGLSTTEMNVTLDASVPWPIWEYSLSEFGQNVYWCSFIYNSAGIIPAGTLGVKDNVGNIAVWGEPITLTDNSGDGSYDGGSSSGGYSSGSTTRTVYYSASTYTTVTPYNGVDLVVETGAMDTLTIGDQALGLSLRRARGNTPNTDEEAASFNASFTDWNGDGAELTDAADGDEAVDTLILTASDADAEQTEDGGYAYSWTFDGSVYKKLAASGIDYLVLSIGEQATALSTAGFTAGIRYNLYRAAGIASKDFVYTIRMEGDDLKVQVSVDGETYEMTNDETSELYYYDLYNGTMEMLDRPFGQEDTTVFADRQG
ncbi:MAG: hypothetical protein PHY64_08420 [Eubacteriales bacterium]|nr:hypothetical protein [Eubacteriales bacterium]